MPEYLAPGVYIEETTFRSRSIEGVPTSTTGFAGATRYGPVQYTNGPSTSEPRLITSFTEFERVYGGLERMLTSGGLRESYVAHAARAFFLNGGQRLYISRVFTPDQGTGVASQTNPPAFTNDNSTITWQARWPGSSGNVRVDVLPVRRGNSATTDAAGTVRASGVLDGAVVEIVNPAAAPSPDGTPLTPAELHVVGSTVDAAGQRTQTFTTAQGGNFVPQATASIREVVLSVTVTSASRRDVYSDLAPSPNQRRWIERILDLDDPEDEDAVVHLRLDRDPANAQEVIELMVALTTNGSVGLTGGDDGSEPTPDDLDGKPGDPDDALKKATGLEALGEIEDIAIVALPDAGTLNSEVLSRQAADRLIGHAERSQYRIAVVDAPRGSSMNEIRSFRGQFDSKYGALYHPWLEILDPLDRPSQGAPPRRILLPPCGFVTGIYARNDITRGVSKAPANEVVRGLTKFEVNINKGRNDVLNPEGINALRFFEGRGNRVWGARTMSSDPEWKYVNVRRFFIFLERSIDLAMQWAVFEPNNERLWANIRQTVEDFLYVQWTSGALLGATPEDAYFVRCDRTTMTQNDFDNGRMICLIGVSPTKPAEYVVFRVGQWTSDARN